MSFGLAQFTEGEVYTPFSYAFNTTYLIVVKYKIVVGSTNDEASLFVFTSTPPGTEPGTPTLGPVTSANTDPADIGTVAVFRSTLSTGNNVLLDGIRVGTSWNDAPLPVQMSSLTATSHSSGTELKWNTETEVNNYGFEIERSAFSTQLSAPSWLKVGFVAGSGTSSSPREYSFVDRGLAAGRYAYRIKQIDHDGTFRYHGNAEVEIGLTEKQFVLESNYPNPFNPSTTIRFTLAEDAKTRLRVFNVLGEQVATLFDEVAQAGRLHEVTFDATRLPSGVYFSTLESGNLRVVKKMVLMK